MNCSPPLNLKKWSKMTASFTSGPLWARAEGQQRETYLCSPRGRVEPPSVRVDNRVVLSSPKGAPLMGAEIYVLPDLPYDYGALEPHISGEIMELHHDKHHAAYVKGANTALEKLANARDSDNFDSINKLQKDLAFNLSGHVLHSLFWQNLSPNGGGEPTGDVATQLTDDFGGFDHFKRHMTEAASTIQGSGW